MIQLIKLKHVFCTFVGRFHGGKHTRIHVNHFLYIVLMFKYFEIICLSKGYKIIFTIVNLYCNCKHIHNQICWIIDPSRKAELCSFCMILVEEVRMVRFFFTESSAMSSSELLHGFMESSATSDSEVLPDLMLAKLICIEDFFERNFTCLPSCDHWDERSQNLLFRIDDLVHLVTAFVKILLTVLIFVVFAIRRKAL